MRLPFRRSRARAAEADRAARLDAALTQFNAGEPSTVDPDLADALTAARAVVADVSGGAPAPHEPVVALRAALAARRNRRRWAVVLRPPRVAAPALGATVAGLIVIAALNGDGNGPPRQAQASLEFQAIAVAEDWLRQADQSVNVLEDVVTEGDPATVQAAATAAEEA